MQLPNDSQRLVIVGRTGSGKTVAGIWHLSRRDYKKMPWIIFDWKRDGLIAKIPAIELELGKLPEKPGLYVVRPLPDDAENVEALLWAIWDRGNIGIYVDEGYMLENNKAYRAIQTQGRSKRIPTITLSQRPVFLDRFIFSEADFYQVFNLNEINDRKRIREWMRDYDVNKKLDNYYSWYYDVGADELAIMRPVPNEKEIISSFEPMESRHFLRLV